jgi:uncharacterized protein (DUF362 family)
VEESLRSLEIDPATGNHVLTQPTFNTADPAPESTHKDTLLTVLRLFRSNNALMSWKIFTVS